MIEQRARVIRNEADSIWLSTEVQAGCSSCQVSGACGTSIVAQLFPRRPEQLLRLSAENLVEQVSPGDHVVLGIEESYLQNTSLLLYAVPLLSLFAGAIAGAWIGEGFFSASIGELLSILLGLLGLLAGLNLVRRKSVSHEKQLEQHARIIRVERYSISIDVPKIA